MISMTNVEQLAEGFCAIAVLHEILRECDRIWSSGAEICAKIVNAQRGWPHSGHQCVARRGAYCLIAVGAFKKNAALCEAIDIGRLNALIAITTEQWFQVVNS